MEVEKKKGWIGLDLDGTLAHYDGYKGPTDIGEPITPMLERVMGFLEAGWEVKIMTARVWHDGTISRMIEAMEAEGVIRGWCIKHLGVILPVTCMKDPDMFFLLDDRAVQVEKNTGNLIGSIEKIGGLS